MSDQPSANTTEFNEAEARRGLIDLVQKIADERFPDPVIKKGTVAVFSGLLALYGDAVQKTATKAQAGQAEARTAELERKLVDAELHAARFHAAWHSARLRAQREASHSRVCRISRNGWKRRAEQAERDHGRAEILRATAEHNAQDQADRRRTAEAAIARVRKLATRWAILRTYGGAAYELREALDEKPGETTPLVHQSAKQQVSHSEGVDEPALDEQPPAT